MEILNGLSNFLSKFGFPSSYISQKNLDTENREKLRKRFNKICNQIKTKLDEIIDIIKKFNEYEKEIVDEANSFDSLEIHIPKTKNNEKYKDFQKIKDNLDKNKKIRLDIESKLYAEQKLEDIIRYDKICFIEEIGDKINIYICKIENMKLENIDKRIVLTKEYKDRIKNFPRVPRPFNSNLILN